MKIDTSDHERRTVILEAGLNCFLTFGFSKTTMQDVARKADISRPLIYLQFKNKTELFIGVLAYLNDGRAERVEKVVNSQLSKTKKLMALSEIVLVEPWSQVTGHPMTAEFYEACSTRFAGAIEKYLKVHFYAAQKILGDNFSGEVYFYATEGLHADLPPTSTLRKRLGLLAERFARGK